MEKFEDLYGLYVACGEGQNDDYSLLKDKLERALKEARRTVVLADHKGFDVGFILFDNFKRVLSCCIDTRELWIGLYDKSSKSIQRYVVFDDIQSLTDWDIKRFVDVIENIARHPENIMNTNDVAKAWKIELANIKSK